ncbi:MAG: recombination mediator RecR [Coraliomargaritaceae bacterium]
MTPAYEKLLQQLKRLPGLGYRSAERIALELLVEKPENMSDLIQALEQASQQVGRCSTCGNIAEDSICSVCADPRRQTGSLCIVEHVPDLVAVERSSAWAGRYHILHGKLSPIHGVGPGDLNFDSLVRRLEGGEIEEIVLALSNDIEGQATCHYIQEEIVGQRSIRVTRIGFGLPSGGGVTFADSLTLKSALEGRRSYS